MAGASGFNDLRREIEALVAENEELKQMLYLLKENYELKYVLRQNTGSTLSSSDFDNSEPFTNLGFREASNWEDSSARRLNVRLRSPPTQALTMAYPLPPPQPSGGGAGALALAAPQQGQDRGRGRRTHFWFPPVPAIVPSNINYSFPRHPVRGRARGYCFECPVPWHPHSIVQSPSSSLVPLSPGLPPRYPYRPDLPALPWPDDVSSGSLPSDTTGTLSWSLPFTQDTTLGSYSPSTPQTTSTLSSGSFVPTPGPYITMLDFTDSFHPLLPQNDTTISSRLFDTLSSDSFHPLVPQNDSSFSSGTFELSSEHIPMLSPDLSFHPLVPQTDWAPLPLARPPPISWGPLPLARPPPISWGPLPLARPTLPNFAPPLFHTSGAFHPLQPLDATPNYGSFGPLPTQDGSTSSMGPIVAGFQQGGTLAGFGSGVLGEAVGAVPVAHSTPGKVNHLNIFSYPNLMSTRQWNFPSPQPQSFAYPYSQIPSDMFDFGSLGAVFENNPLEQTPPQVAGAINPLAGDPIPRTVTTIRGPSRPPILQPYDNTSGIVAGLQQGGTLAGFGSGVLGESIGAVPLAHSTPGKVDIFSYPNLTSPRHMSFPIPSPSDSYPYPYSPVGGFSENYQLEQTTPHVSGAINFLAGDPPPQTVATRNRSRAPTVPAAPPAVPPPAMAPNLAVAPGSPLFSWNAMPSMPPATPPFGTRTMFTGLRTDPRFYPHTLHNPPVFILQPPPPGRKGRAPGPPQQPMPVPTIACQPPTDSQRPPDVRPRERPFAGIVPAVKTGDIKPKEKNRQERIIGEIAFQLDRRILANIFPTRTRLYGFTVSNVPDKVAQGRANTMQRMTPEESATALERYNIIMDRLRPLGYDPEIHPRLMEHIINTFGILRDRPDVNDEDAIYYNDVLYLRNVIKESAPPDVRNVCMLLLECLYQLSQDDGKPLFLW